MPRIIVTMAALGWAAILGLAWWLADSRIELCNYRQACIIDATETRDNVLVIGLAIGLAIALFIVARMVRNRADWIMPASRANRQLR